MSEKRFKRGMNLSCFDTETRKSYWYACNLCGLLNELVEENKQLRKQVAEYEMILRQHEFAEQEGFK